MSAHDEQQAQELERFANRAHCRPEYGGVPHYCPNCDNSIEFPVEALKAGAAALRRASPETGNAAIINELEKMKAFFRATTPPSEWGYVKAAIISRIDLRLEALAAPRPQEAE